MSITRRTREQSDGNGGVAVQIMVNTFEFGSRLPHNRKDHRMKRGHTMDIKRKQHILPASYLKHWVDPATTLARKTPMVWTLSKDGKSKQLKSPTSGHFWRDYFYDLVSISGGRRQDLENLLGKIENSMARIVDQRILQKQPLDRMESENFDLFVACVYMRTERIKESVGSFVSAKARIEKDCAQAQGKPIPDTSVMEHNAHAHAIYDGILFISEALAKMSHNIFVAPEGKAYLTSDTPCVWQAPLGFAGLANPLLEITVPLTPGHLLLISKTIPTSGYIDALDFMVDVTNWEMIRRCRSYCVANSSALEASCLESEAYWGMRLLQEAAKLG
jgi:hypothetical protein